MDNNKKTEIKNKELHNVCIQLGALSAVGFGLQTYWRYESARLGDNSGTLQLTQSTFFGLESTPMNIGVVFMIIFFIASLLLYPFIAPFCYKIIERRIKRKNPKERIIFAYRPFAFSATIFYAISGFFLGCYIIPFLFFSNMTHIDMVTHNNLTLYLLLCFILLLSAFTFQYNTVILTNEQIINSFPFFPLWTKSMFLKNLKYVQKIENTLAIISKTGDTISLDAWRKKKAYIFEQKLRETLQKTRRIIDGYRGQYD